jgi:uncharacterized protein YdaU (DUF1376 family)
MNYYERHLGDYMKNCGHLSLLEHGIYVRLLDVYYTREAPIPDDKAARLIRAATAPETEALQVVLEEFFILIDGHWHQPRADEEIAAYQAGEPEREVKKANENNRLARHRAERAELFKIITDAGLHAPWNIKIDELRKMADEVKTANTEKPATGTATPATATQSPITTPHTPDIKTTSMDKSSHQSNVSDGDDLKQPGDWFSWFNRNHGTQYDAHSLHDRKTLMQIFTRWHNEQITPGQVNEAIAHAYATAKGPIANLAAYTDRVLVSMQSERVQQTAGQKRAANLNQAVAEFLGESKPDQEPIIEGEYRHE